MSTPPNVVLVITDDQGYGDLSCHGNPILKTPNIDRHYHRSVRLDNFHVSPLCAPTRSAIMTGRYPLRNGCWATAWGRSLLRRDETTLADVFTAGGYATGLFGKWHLGDNYPYRPHDRGFQEVLAHKGGGVGQVPDYWGNNYFDDTYFRNNDPEQCKGYCTDIWFDEGMKFIERNKDKPFFCMISTNAPHWPYLVEERYAAPYRDNDDVLCAEFYGMVANIDENFGRLMNHLDTLGLTDDTILIFMTDNGPDRAASFNGEKGWNDGMRGSKGSYYDGGHRVPFLAHWPNGGWKDGREIDALISHIDLLPTLIDICNLPAPPQACFDGINVAPLLRGEIQELPERFIFVQKHQSHLPPKKWNNAVLYGPWRLVHGKELYNIEKDSAQRNNVADQYPEIVEQLRSAHQTWWKEVSPQLEVPCPITIGDEAENPCRLDAMDILGDMVWKQEDIIAAKQSSGTWAIDVARAGRYTFRLQRWPDELNLPIDAVIDNIDCRGIHPVKAKIRIGEQQRESPVTSGEKAVTFTLHLEPGETRLETWFMDAAGNSTGAYYVYIKRD